MIVSSRSSASASAATILAADDPALDYGFGDTQYPLKFWKVVATVSAQNRNKPFVTGFVLDQGDLVDEQGLEHIDVSPWKRNRRTPNQITEMTGVIFPKILVDADTPA